MLKQKPYLYQRYNNYFASVCDGVEDLLKQELMEMGIQKSRAAYRGVYFEAKQTELYRVNLNSALVTRVYAPLMKFDCHSTKYLHKTAMKIKWDDFLDLNSTFAVNATVSNSAIRHSRYAALCLKDAIADSFRKFHGARPSVNKENPDVWVSLHVENNKATVSLDTSGGSLHRRGYRVATVEAPMREVVAAAIIRMSDWHGDRPLYDPMCGSGTLLSEALISYCGISPAYKRKTFGFERMPDFNMKTWNLVRSEPEDRIQSLPRGLISGSDIDSGAIQSASQNLNQLPSGKNVGLSVKDFQHLKNINDSVIVCNPPYGMRLGSKKEAAALYRRFGQFLKRKCRGSQAYIYFGDPYLIPQIGLEPSWQKPLKNGGLKGQLVKFEIGGLG